MAKTLPPYPHGSRSTVARQRGNPCPAQTVANNELTPFNRRRQLEPLYLSNEEWVSPRARVRLRESFCSIEMRYAIFQRARFTDSSERSRQRVTQTVWLSLRPADYNIISDSL